MRFIQENHAAKLTKLLSMYHALRVSQVSRYFPELNKEQFKTILHQLEKKGRIIQDPDADMLFYGHDCSPDPAILKAFWVLLDFMDHITYHTISDFPVTLTFYTDSEAYDVIHVAEEKEILMNQILSAHHEDAPRRLVIIEHPDQLARISFPGIWVYCMVASDGQIQYFKKQEQQI